MSLTIQDVTLKEKEVVVNGDDVDVAAAHGDVDVETDVEVVDTTTVKVRISAVANEESVETNVASSQKINSTSSSRYKTCTTCNKMLPLHDFIGKRKTNESTREWKMCNTCRIQWQGYGKTQQAQIMDPDYGSQQYHKYKEQKKEYHEAVHKVRLHKKQQQLICEQEGCFEPKVTVGQPYGRCKAHGGIYHVMVVIRSNMWKAIRTRQKIDGVETMRTQASAVCVVQDLIAIYKKQNGICVYCGIFLTFTRGSRRHDAISADRIDSGKSYCVNNVVFCCHFCNVAKNKMPLSMFSTAFTILFSGGFDVEQQYHNFPGHHACAKLNEWLDSPRRMASGSRKTKASAKEGAEAWGTREVFTLAHKQQFRCAITGIPFCLCKVPHCPFQPSMDRIDNLIRDYSVKENCQLVLMIINLARNHMSVEELLDALNTRLQTFAQRNHALYLDHVQLNYFNGQFPCLTTTDCVECQNLEEHQHRLMKVKTPEKHIEFAKKANHGIEFQPAWKKVSRRQRNEKDEISDNEGFDETHQENERKFQEICAYLDSPPVEMIARSGCKRKRHNK